MRSRTVPRWSREPLRAAGTVAYAEDDPRIELYRQALAALKQIAQPPACDQAPEPARWVED
jgi:hypothetical protein